jgi:hypothetical protein
VKVRNRVKKDEREGGWEVGRMDGKSQRRKEHERRKRNKRKNRRGDVKEKTYVIFSIFTYIQSKMMK